MLSERPHQLGGMQIAVLLSQVRANAYKLVRRRDRLRHAVGGRQQPTVRGPVLRSARRAGADLQLAVRAYCLRDGHQRFVCAALAASAVAWSSSASARPGRFGSRSPAQSCRTRSNCFPRGSEVRIGLSAGAVAGRRARGACQRRHVYPVGPAPRTDTAIRRIRPLLRLPQQHHHHLPVAGARDARFIVTRKVSVVGAGSSWPARRQRDCFHARGDSASSRRPAEASREHGASAPAEASEFPLTTSAGQP